MLHRRMRCCLLSGCVLIVASASSVTRADDIPVADMQPTVANLLDPNWIENSLHEVGVDRLIKIYDEFDDPLTERVQQALILSRWFLMEHPEELRSQLQARLLSSDEPELQVFQELPAEGIHVRAMRASLNQAGDGLVGALSS